MHFSNLCSVALLAATTVAQSLEPLHTSSRWIVDKNNKRFKLRCINWAGHMEASIPEGFQHQPLESITKIVADSGFNCVRLTFSIEMALDQGKKVSDVFGGLAARTGADAGAVSGLWDTIKSKNPWLADITVGEAYGKVIDSLGARNVRVMLDNHVSNPSWCCNLEDGNGWWDEGSSVGVIQNNSRYFNETAWTLGLAAMARLAANHPAVAGIGLRNEIREVPVLQSRDTWYDHVARGAKAVHDANGDLLIAVGGTLSSTDASFLRTRPFDRSPYGDKVVWEFHHYTFTPSWIASFKNCNIWKSVSVGGTVGFLIQQGRDYTGPLWLSEFGFGQRGSGPMDVSGQEDYDYITCLVDYIKGNDVDWAIWALQGNYYVRDKNVNQDEPWGILNGEWSEWRNPKVKDILADVFKVTQGP
ncbi:glycoside hydrolase family 5 protein [Periconia macrospinosa]|uniref:Glycoside hydrolase family 5 protein n=1 Tax=Periconia macrospinosa TaxID=97972 RepID=A0A2V1E016_9PLEO|nr:glycoside hydrolase family 5 protein [Periconia macrospinosa]